MGQGRTDNNLECRGPSLSSAAWRRVFRACANTAEPRGCEAGHDGETSKRHPIRSCRAVVVVITSPHATYQIRCARYGKHKGRSGSVLPRILGASI